MRRYTESDKDRFNIDQPFNFAEDANWRIFRIMAEFIEGFEFLAPLRKEITFFGSARLLEGSKWYREARRLGTLLAKEQFTIITGGGPGIMEAGNRGAFEGGGESVGIDIELPEEQRRNKYVKTGRGFHYFFTRKVMMSASAQAYVFFPGGLGTLDEFFEIITLIQTEKMEAVPVVCMGHDFWDPLHHWMRTHLVEAYGTIAPEDTELYSTVDTADEALKILRQSKERKYF